MKGNLPATEPKVLARWEEERLHEKLLEARKGAEPFILHDGPPYANGDIHMGHALNKILKDLIVRYRAMRGHRAPVVPGWDCHGLPIEHALMKELKITKHQVEVGEFRKQARAYALKYVGIQRDQFKRLGLLGDWEHPYLTLEPGYVAAELRSLAKLVSKGYVYRARKPVNWCWSCETALAEAEVEYEQRKDLSVYVKFLLTEDWQKRWIGSSQYQAPVSVLIWTTTPWTLPANMGLCFHPKEEYVIAEIMRGQEHEYLIIAAKRVDPVLKITGCQLVREHARFSGKALVDEKNPVASLHCYNPLNPNDQSQAVMDLGVSMEEGTGIIHIAPGHGPEDYAIGKKWALAIFSPVDGQGRFDPQVPKWKGMKVLEANPEIVEELRKNGKLLYEQSIEHSYPHCWRCHEPIIFRATAQWFLNVEHEGLRGKLLQVAEGQVRWIPPVGRERMGGMLKTRPDWCLSRQRLWGVPIPALICKNPKCNGGWLVPETIENFARAVESAPDAVDRWFTDAYKEWIPEGLQCLDCGGEEFVQGTDILDVWFDSGVSYEAVLKHRKELTHPADMVLEGSDQHRGWFQVSLITGTALEGKAPYRSALTHGFVVDGEGRKMSKSLGNVMAPAQVIDSSGADVLRLWVASSDYAEDVRLSPVILSQVSESYRKIRNTIRFCLANISDYVPPGPNPPKDRMRSLDRWILGEMGSLVVQVTDAYDAYAFHRAVKGIHEFCTIRLSNFYLDVVKDILYTAHPDDAGRRSAQAALYWIARTLILLLSPILPVTAEEAWAALPHPVPLPSGERVTGEGKSVHLERWPAAELHPQDPSLSEDWRRLLALRDEAMKALEKARASGLIGDALEVELEIGVRDEKLWSFLEARREDFREACILSGLKLVRADGAEADPSFTVRKAPGAKCERCWMRLESVGRSPEHPGLCHRCVEVVHRLTRLR